MGALKKSLLSPLNVYEIKFWTNCLVYKKLLLQAVLV